MMAPGTLPKPPMTMAAKAFEPAVAPMVLFRKKMGASSPPQMPVMAALMAKVMPMDTITGMPQRLDIYWSCAVACIMLPIKVFSSRK